MLSFELRRPQESYPRSLLSTWDAFTKDFDSFFQAFDTSHNARRSYLAPQAQLAACDIQESEKGFLLSFDLPGFKREDINVEWKGKTLTVSGKRQRENDVQEHRKHWQERHHGEFKRAFTLPENVKGDEIEASYENGVLYVLVPKTEIVQPKRLTIGEGKGQLFRTVLAEHKNEDKQKEGALDLKQDPA